MVGVPLIFLSLPIFLRHRQTGLKLFAAGWALQFVGHYFFEKNQPVLFSRDTHPMTILASAVYVYQSWARLLSGRPIVDAPTAAVIELMATPAYGRRQAL
jgi:uncharacterized membrane protein YGL010W